MRGKPGGFMLREDMKVIKGGAVQIWGLLGTSLAWCTTVARYMTGESWKKVRRILEETDALS